MTDEKRYRQLSEAVVEAAVKGAISACQDAFANVIGECGVGDIEGFEAWADLSEELRDFLNDHLDSR